MLSPAEYCYKQPVFAWARVSLRVSLKHFTTLFQPKLGRCCTWAWIAGYWGQSGGMDSEYFLFWQQQVPNFGMSRFLEAPPRTLKDRTVIVPTKNGGYNRTYSCRATSSGHVTLWVVLVRGVIIIQTLFDVCIWRIWWLENKEGEKHLLAGRAWYKVAN